MMLVSTEPKTQPFIAEVDGNGDPYMHQIEQELSGILPRPVRYSDRMKVYRRWWWNALLALFFYLVFATRQSFTTSPDWLSVASGLVYILLVPLSFYGYWEYYWRKPGLLATGVATIAQAKSGSVVGEKRGREYFIKYHARIGHALHNPLEAETAEVSQETYLALTTGNPYFTLLYDRDNPKHRAVYADIKYGMITLKSPVRYTLCLLWV